MLRFHAVFVVSAVVGGACSAALAIGCSSSGGANGAPLPDAGGAPADGAGVEVDAAPAPAADPIGFRSAGQLKEARALATVTRLGDGRVLVVGGEDSSYGMIASAEIFDPKTNAFVAAAPLPEPRDHHSATLLKSGKVLVVGGGQGSEISLPTGDKTMASAVLYDPVANTWTQTGDMHAPRAGHRAVLLDDGRVLVAGGGSVVGYPCNSIHPNCNIADSIGTVEIYDPATGTWSSAAPLAHPRLAFAMNATSAGIVASGGAAANQGLTSVEIFDPASGAWHNGPDLPGQRLYHSTALVSGHLVAAGGKIANVMPITSVDVLDEAASAWSAGPPLKEARTGASLVPLQSGRALIVAGDDQLGMQALAEAAIYDPAASTWTSIKPLATGRYSQSAVLLDDGSVLVVGGRDDSGALATVERSR